MNIIFIIICGVAVLLFSALIIAIYIRERKEKRQKKLIITGKPPKWTDLDCLEYEYKQLYDENGNLLETDEEFMERINKLTEKNAKARFHGPNADLLEEAYQMTK